MRQGRHLPKGALVISIDLELAWGVWDKLRPESLTNAASLESGIVHELLALFDKYGVTATWAIVGRLLVDPSGSSDTPGPRGAWFAPELVDAIKNATVKQEIGSHGYGHKYFGHEGRDILEQDLRAAKMLHLDEGISFNSFVFPRNQVNHLDLLAAAGLKVFRSRDAGVVALAERFGSRVRSAVNWAEKCVPAFAPVVWPIRHPGGLVELPSSLLLLGRNGLRQAIPPRLMIAKCRTGLRRAAQQRGVFHLWFHPSNFYYQRERQMLVLERTLREARALVDRGQLEIRCMGSFADTE